MASSEETRITFCRETFTTRSHDRSKNIIDTFVLDGHYAIKSEYLNKASVVQDVELDHAILSKAVYCCGNILYKTNEPKVWEYIDLIIEATYRKNLSVEVDKSVGKSKQVLEFSVCPTKDTIFAYDGKLFHVYGKYVYGYDYRSRYVRFVNEDFKNAVDNDDDESDKGEESDSDEEGVIYECKELPASITKKEIVLPTIPYNTKHEHKSFFDDHTYAFAITEGNDEDLLAFALYR